MPAPALGKPLPRAGDAFTSAEKWALWILAEEHHGADWLRVFGQVERDTVWTALSVAVLTAPVMSVRQVPEDQVVCRVDVSLTMNSRTATVRSIWHYAKADAPPRLVTAFPTT